MEPVKILIVDDHSMVREGLKQILEIDGTIEVMAEAGDGEECLKMLETIKPEVILLDINMPKLNGLEVLKILKKRKCKSKVIVLTIHNEIDYLIKAMDIGCNGYVLKDSDSLTLKKAIVTVKDGETYIEPSLTQLLNSSLVERDMAKDKVDELTTREKEVLILIANGMFNREIGIKLDISERTVKNHIANIFKKISVSDRTQAAVFAIKNGLVDIK